MSSAVLDTFRFGQFELDAAAGELRRDGRRRRLQAQPLKLLVLLVRRADAVVTYEDIRAELWGEGTFVEFDQAVHYAIRQIREALGDAADRPLYVETVPRRGYRFIAPVEAMKPPPPAPAPAQGGGTTVRLQKALWANIVELRLAEAQRQRTQTIWMSAILAAVLILIGVGVFLIFRT